MSQDMGNQVSQNLKKQQAMYDDFFGRWNKLSAEVGSRLSRERENEGVREFYHVWKNYASRMGPRLQKAVTEGLQGYDTVTHSLDKYTRKMKERAQGLLAKPKEPRSLDDLYGAWQEFGTSVRKQIQGAMGQGLVEADELTRTWLDFSSRMDKLVSDVGAQGAEYADLAELWQKFSKEIGGSLMSVVNGTGKDMDVLQKTWSDYYSKVEREMVQLASDVGMSYQQLYIRFFEQQSEALNSLGQWWQTAVETTRKQLGDTERRP
ncbi:MAG: hypothetical protein A3K59_00335 [Euryarchaeota archaeon RBG_19FT_COMBO_69_17]|nr:MAG: hypothetical protein A3K59_00335 [Euryarchaeota archaeon RBG_19FT_COMBO_69_17]